MKREELHNLCLFLIRCAGRSAHIQIRLVSLAVKTFEPWYHTLLVGGLLSYLKSCMRYLVEKLDFQELVDTTGCEISAI